MRSAGATRPLRPTFTPRSAGFARSSLRCAHPSRTLTTRVASALAKWTGEPEHSLFAIALIAAVISVPFWPASAARRAAVFTILFCAVAFLTMASVRYTGAAHHIVLLYPAPHILTGIANSRLKPV